MEQQNDELESKIAIEKARQIQPFDVDKLRAFLNYFAKKQYQNDEEKNEFFNSFIYRVVLFDDCIYIFYNTSPTAPTKVKLNKDDLTELREHRKNRKSTRFVPLGFKLGALGGVWHLKLELFASSILALSWAFSIAVSISSKAIGVSSIRL